MSFFVRHTLLDFRGRFAIARWPLDETTDSFRAQKKRQKRQKRRKRLVSHDALNRPLPQGPSHPPCVLPRPWLQPWPVWLFQIPRCLFWQQSVNQRPTASLENVQSACACLHVTVVAPQATARNGHQPPACPDDPGAGLATSPENPSPCRVCLVWPQTQTHACCCCPQTAPSHAHPITPPPTTLSFQFLLLRFLASRRSADSSCFSFMSADL